MTTPDPFASPGDAPPAGSPYAGAPAADDPTATYLPPVAPPAPLPAAPWPAVPGAQPAAPAGPPPGAQPATPAWPPAGAVPPGAAIPPGASAGPSAPTKSAQPGLVAGVILVVIGAIVLLGRVVELSLDASTWPVWIVVPGLAMLVGSFFIPPRGGVGLAIPGAIVTMVGLVLWVQDTYDLYATWAYAWALVAPTGVGLGMLLYGIVHRDRELQADGLRTTLVGLGLFLGFALFFEGVIGLSGRPIENMDEILPYAAIGLGVLLVVLSFVGGRRRKETSA
jgi:hypothetical protein